ncbi:MAG TPA: sigma 54-interacting transcriptional regulator [Pyrinomonadaceae bacterium]|jgi:transcriptional regulator with GAF, ATPase, and Fis domain/Tfp pilus assembly protein PilF
MAKDSQTGRDANKERGAVSSDVVNLEDARARLRSRGRNAPTRESLVQELEAIHVLLDQGLSSEAESRLGLLLKAARHDASQLAMTRCALSAALEMKGRYRESLEAVAMYESAESRARLDEEAKICLRVQIGLAYNYTGDHPKAIALLNATLRDVAESGTDEQRGSVYIALARVYRSISEFTIARDHADKALEHYRREGSWRGMAEAYFGIAVADMQLGDYESTLSNFEQALKLVGNHPATYLLGKIHTNMAGACWFLKRPRDGIRFLEKAIGYYERTDHKANAADGYNNLGINLILVGDWDRAQRSLERALSLASEIDERAAKVPMILDSLGELRMLRGDLEDAESYLTRAVTLATENGNKWYAGQALRTLGRCRLAMGEIERALADGREAFDMAERIGDRQAICDSRLLLAASYLQQGLLDECAEELQHVTVETAESAPDLALAGEAQRLEGMLAAAHEDATLAAHHFGRSISIFELLGDRYRGALAHYGMGSAYASTQPDRAEEHLQRAALVFRELGAELNLAQAEEAMSALEREARIERRAEQSALSQLLTLRLTEAVASRELLLRELAAVIQQETNARRVLIIESAEAGQYKAVVSHGCTAEEIALYTEELAKIGSDTAPEEFAAKHDIVVIPLRAANAPSATLLIAPRTAAALPDNVSLQPLLRVVELGMDVCALRERERTGRDQQEHTTLVDQSLLPGFIHSSPAMTRLVEEVHKIRSSDVTVLVTGESGTGKELVSRAIHAISSRRNKVFVPFNCTAVPKELTEGYLFGYRRGAFTGAVSDSPGVIRTAAGGTLFLDEIGDLPIDVQPKLLRFLQEGEIQPLGEQRPVKVDVRIIAATNTDLEELVAAGKFREDLYYRLNVIRLRVPPLRERRSEIPTIVNYYINHYSAKFGRRDIQMTPQSVDLLMVSDWPGNVRQLCNEIQRIVARAEDGTTITPDNLSPELKRTSAPLGGAPATVASIGTTTSAEGMTLADALAEVERRMIAEALRKHCGNISRAARELGLTRRGLYLKLERHDLSATG